MSIQNLNVKSIHLYQHEKKNKLEDVEYLNLPDLHFFIWCQNKFKVNKGVYNTIDNWFYEYGVVSIIHRRIHIIAFLDYASKEKDPNQHKYVRFGNGGLTRKLNDFIEETETGGFNI